MMLYFIRPLSEHNVQLAVPLEEWNQNTGRNETPAAAFLTLKRLKKLPDMVRRNHHGKIYMLPKDIEHRLSLDSCCIAEKTCSCGIKCRERKKLSSGWRNITL
jgi:hypothetical protein